MTRTFILQALSPLHPGTGQAQGAIDLPIARLRGTNIPFLPGSSIKGVLRQAAREAAGQDVAALKLLRATFGPEVEEKDDRHAGGVSFGDARLLALPVRSFVGTFAWVTSPLLLHLARRDLSATAPAVPQIPTGKALVSDAKIALRTHLFLEELDCEVASDAQGLALKWAQQLSKLILPANERSLFESRFAIVDDETMTFLSECCTQVDARVRIDHERGVVQDGALWYEESLPAETLLIGIATATDRAGYTANALLAGCMDAPRLDLQFGGKATVGRGRAALHPVK